MRTENVDVVRDIVYDCFVDEECDLDVFCEYEVEDDCVLKMFEVVLSKVLYEVYKS